MIESRRVGGKQIVTLVECPACGRDLRGQHHPSKHIAEHVPRDFGLSPLRKRRRLVP